MVYIQMHVAGGGQTVKFVLCAGNTQSLHFSCADTAYMGMLGMESTRGNRTGELYSLGGKRG